MNLEYLKPLVIRALCDVGYWLWKLGVSAEQRRAVWLHLASLEDGRRWWER